MAGESASATAGLWYVGIMLEVVSTMSGTVGKQLIRLSEQKRRQKALKQSALLFQIGLFVNTVMGPLVDVAAYSFAAQSLIAPFGGLDVVWNAMLAPWILNEKLTPKRVLGCALIVLGTVLAGVFGNHTDSEYSLDYLEELLINERVGIYFIGFFLWFLFNRFFLMRWSSGSAIRGISLGCTAGTIAGNMFCVKAAIELIQRSIEYGEGEIWTHWLPYALVFGAIFFAVSNVIYMTKGLQEYEALFMVTIYEGSMIVSGCISGSVVLLDQRGLEAWRIGLYFFSVLIVVAGMCVIFMQERMSKSSLASGTASIAEIQRPEWANRHGRDFLHELGDRSLHASCSHLPPESPAGEGGFSRNTSPGPSSPAGSKCGIRTIPADDGDETQGAETTAPKDGTTPSSGNNEPGDGALPQIQIIDFDEEAVREKPTREATESLAAAPAMVAPPVAREPRLEALAVSSPTCCTVGESQGWCFGFVSPITPSSLPQLAAQRADSDLSSDRQASSPKKRIITSLDSPAGTSGRPGAVLGKSANCIPPAGLQDRE
mmetsp:Transcript_105807/g.207525  ORF Transcript_105807/g.207525 Transcript_105807/m.207525 type:complete len:544 (-) Transcript_105807:380-2011(-)